ncbi:hypothetical protein CWC46_14280 [Prodigiosinella confusarubida]|uniref:Uncharacterized protein n=1 Tax=Serratia sp. (strain ATCC 39006) TaxID=104623 RepID=A0A2I5T8N2_SERS3|nr:hypothetical protein [Serratia sp. ATCC 39006]AUH00872.1 hypothetical protein CWC46_14280 [Serratia sp. ATCC 39006]AUH05194.1 hypothetical protein Ser39006_014285 [Serratia sp. ATCC 39006]
MIKRFLAWLKSIYFKPALAETKTPEVESMSESLVDSQAAAERVATVAQPAAVANVDEAKVGVSDFDAR